MEEEERGERLALSGAGDALDGRTMDEEFTDLEFTELLRVPHAVKREVALDRVACTN
jgi:hypothetical protein